MPMMMAGAVPEVLSKAVPDASSSSRKLFPETWIWSDLISGFDFILFLTFILFLANSIALIIKFKQVIFQGIVVVQKNRKTVEVN